LSCLLNSWPISSSLTIFLTILGEAWKLCSSLWNCFPTSYHLILLQLRYFPPRLVSSWIKFGLLLLFPNIWTMPHFQRICLLSLCHYLSLRTYDWRGSNIHLVFTFKPTSILASIRVCVLIYGVYIVTQQIYIISIDQQLTCSI
jgi:hypothetical protein